MTEAERRERARLPLKQDLAFKSLWQEQANAQAQAQLGSLVLRLRAELAEGAQYQAMTAAIFREMRNQ